MKKMKLWMILALVVLSCCLFVTLVGCDLEDETPDGDGTEPELGFTISLPTEIMAGERAEIVITKIGDIELYHDYYEWNIIDENTVNGTFEFEKLDKDGSYTNKFFVATVPGKVKIQAVNSYNGVTYTSNIVEVTVKGHQISSVQDLINLENSDKSYQLAADIDLSHENNWEPIKGFTGVLDGCGHKITNLTMNNYVENLGLFEVLEGTVKDLVIENVNITARGDAGNAGAVAGTNKGTISNVTVKGVVAPEYYSNVGGIVGYNDGGKVLNCTNEATVNGKDNVGGIVGKIAVAEDNAITGCRNRGTVTGKNSVGGVMGYLTSVTQQKSVLYVVTNNENGGKVTGDSQVGGVIGQVFGMDYGNDYWYGTFEISVLTNTADVVGSTTGSNAGGIIGKATRLNVLSSIENTGDVTGGTCVGGVVGYALDTNIKATGMINENTITGTAKVGGIAGHAGIIENATNNGEIVATGVLIEGNKSCNYVGGIAGYCTGIIGCENNADISTSVAGTYVGGIAGYVTIKDNDLVNDNINYGKISGKIQVGGIAGYLTMPAKNSNLVLKITNNENKGTVTGESQVGGVFGEAFGFDYNNDYWYGYFEIIALSNSAAVTGSATGNDVGGLIGKATRLKVLSAAENTADVSGGDCVGGFVGNAPDAHIKASGFTNNRTISGKYKVGGFAGVAGLIEYAINRGTIVVTGPNASGEACIGGIAGYCNGVIGCENYADIKIENAGMYIGGIAGYLNVLESNKVNDNVNYGEIKGAQSTGGIAGYMTMPRKSSKLNFVASNNKNNGVVTGTSKVGGIFGAVDGMYYNDNYIGTFEVVNSVNTAEVTGTEYVGGIVGAYTRMKTDENVMNTNTTTHGNKLGQ